MDSISPGGSSDCTNASDVAEDGVLFVHVLVLHGRSIRGDKLFSSSVFSSNKGLWSDEVGRGDTPFNRRWGALIASGRNSDLDCGVLHTIHDSGNGRVYDRTGIIDDAAD